MLQKLRANRRAFTLIELLVVMVVISVLALILIPQFANQRQKSQEAALRSDLALIRRAIATYRADVGTPPATLTDLVTVPATPPTGYQGPYIQGGIVPKDPANNGAAYTYTAATGEVKSGNATYSTW